MKINLVDVDPKMVEAWREEFSSLDDVSIHQGSIVDLANCTVVSPANSYGYMDGGVDAVYRRHFGKQIEKKVKGKISKRSDRILPVGAAIVVTTRNERVPFMIVAPTMEMPEAVPADNAYRAFRAVLRVAKQNEEHITELYCPGMATGVGQVDPRDSAKAMRQALEDHRSEQVASHNSGGCARSV